MGKFLKAGRIVLLLQGRYAGKKAIIVKVFDDGSKARPFGHCLVAGVERPPLKVTKRMSKKKITRLGSCSGCDRWQWPPMAAFGQGPWLGRRSVRSVGWEKEAPPSSRCAAATAAKRRAAALRRPSRRSTAATNPGTAPPAALLPRRHDPSRAQERGRLLGGGDEPRGLPPQGVGVGGRHDTQERSGPLRQPSGAAEKAPQRHARGRAAATPT